MSLYSIFEHTHSGLRWVLILLFVLTIYRLFVEAFRGSYSPKTLQFGKFTVIVAHIQVLIGLVLYFFLSPKVHFDPEAMKSTFLRFYLVEHISMMLIAVILLTIAWVKGKKKEAHQKRARYLFTWFVVAFVIILAAIPWPFRTALGGGWF
ncbi:MAG: cytochrome B [Bacteroidetes bacterium]|nr:cytochrome B [Bacteroidota bacterium]